MKKSLIALAVLAASGAAMAQSTVSIYGIVDAWFGRTDLQDHAGVSQKQTVLNSGGVSGSRFGFKGSEDLGGGLKANFVLEQGFNVDNGAAGAAGSAFARQSTVGFSGGFGEVKVGKAYTPFDDINGATDAVFDSALSPMNVVFLSTKYNANPANTIYYTTPSFSGFTAAVSYSLGENKSNGAAPAGFTNDASDIASFNVQYTGGPLYLAAAYQTEKLTSGGFTSDESVKFTRLNASYDFGVAKALANYGRTALDGAKTTDWQVGVDFPVSTALTLSASYATSKGDLAYGTGVANNFSTFGTSSSATTWGNTTNGSDIKRSGWGIGANYALSKRTSVYGGYMSAKEDANTSVAGFANDAEIKYLALGVKHTF